MLRSWHPPESCPHAWNGWCWPLWSPKTFRWAFGQPISGLLEVSLGLAPVLGSPALSPGTLLCLGWLSCGFSPAGGWDNSTLRHKLFFSGIVNNLFISMVSYVAFWPHSKCHYLVNCLISYQCRLTDQSKLLSHFVSRFLLHWTYQMYLLSGWGLPPTWQGQKTISAEWIFKLFPAPLPQVQISLSLITEAIPAVHPFLAPSECYEPALSMWKNKEFRDRKLGLKSSFLSLPTVRS